MRSSAIYRLYSTSRTNIAGALKSAFIGSSKVARCYTAKCCAYMIMMVQETEQRKLEPTVAWPL